MRWTGRPVDGRSCKVLLYRLCTRVDRVPQLGHEAVGDIARSVSVISSATLICSMSTETWPAVRASDSSAWISRAHRMLNELYFRLKHLGRLVQHSRLSTDKV